MIPSSCFLLACWKSLQLEIVVAMERLPCIPQPDSPFTLNGCLGLATSWTYLSEMKQMIFIVHTLFYVLQSHHGVKLIIL